MLVSDASTTQNPSHSSAAPAVSRPARTPAAACLAGRAARCGRPVRGLRSPRLSRAPARPGCRLRVAGPGRARIRHPGGMSVPPAAPLPPPLHPGGTYRICLVCLGNICRSPMAEVVLTSELAAAGLRDSVTVDSAGTGDWHLGHQMDAHAAAELSRRGYDGSAHRARQVRPSWLADRDLILAMDRRNLADLRRLAAQAGVGTDRIRLFGEAGGLARPRRRRPRHPGSLRRRCRRLRRGAGSHRGGRPAHRRAADRAAGGPCPRLRASPGASARWPAPGSGTCTGPGASTGGGTTGSPWPTAARRSPRSPIPAPGLPSTPKPVACAGWPAPSPCRCRTSSAGTTLPSCCPGYPPAAPIRTRPTRSVMNSPGCTPPARTASALRGRGSSRACRWTTLRGRPPVAGPHGTPSAGCCRTCAVPRTPGRWGRPMSGWWRRSPGGSASWPARGSRRAASTGTAGPAT